MHGAKAWRSAFVSVLTCQRADEHERECASLTLRDEGQVAWWNVRGLLDVVPARSRVVDAVRLDLAQEHDLQSTYWCVGIPCRFEP